MMQPVVFFDNGTLRFEAYAPEDAPPELSSLVQFDARAKCYRARACDYAGIMLSLLAAGIPVTDRARDFLPQEWRLSRPLIPRPHQQQAFDAWKKAACRGIAVLPTGAGKTVLAVMAIAHLQRPTLVLVPTIDLLQQWATVLEGFFGIPIGMLGGGERDIQPLTVSTYDSAVLQMEFIGNRFGFLVADECHHLPGPVYRMAAALSLAPFRLGLSATPESDPERDNVMYDLLGEVVCRVHIGDLEGEFLSPYVTRQLPVPLDADEAAEYQLNRKIYTDFLRANAITFRRNSDWGRFLGLCARSAEGKRVLNAFFTQRRIARGGRAKVRLVWELMARHAGERMIIFTADNASAYQLGREFCLPVITHHTVVRERKEMLDFFREGRYPVLVTSKVLNEGVDVPAAGVGIVLSGSASVREHVQRLGRILRPAPGKEQAILYELIGAGTSEESVSARRREHEAYQGKEEEGDDVDA